MKKSLTKYADSAKYYEKIGYAVIKTFIDDEKLPDMLGPILKVKQLC